MTRVYRESSPPPANDISLQDVNSKAAAAFSEIALLSATPSPIPVLGPKYHTGYHSTSDPSTQKVKQTLCPKARLRIHIEDLSHPAIPKFTQVADLGTLLENAVVNVQQHLFTPPKPVFGEDRSTSSNSRPPPQHPIPSKPHWAPQEVRSLTLILRPMGGVAYTSGTELDEAHKEIHLSLDYLHDRIKQFYPKPTEDNHKPAPTASVLPPSSSSTLSDQSKGDSSFLHELHGVLTHESVHAFQHNAGSTCPGGLIEGIADYVRLKSDLGAEHWNPWPANHDTRGDKWDEGYQKTAWFLEWVEEQADFGGKGCIGRLNEAMRKHEWNDGAVWKDIMHDVSVEECWGRYIQGWEELNKKHEKNSKGGK